MIRCEELAEVFKENELTFFSGVPDSTFKDWMKFLADGNGLTNIIAVNECEATAIASGYHLATKKIGVVYMQNSGLGKTVNPVTSLCSKDVYSIPVLFMIGWRGEPGVKDEPQHKMMGRIMFPLLDVLEIPYEILPRDIRNAKQTIKKMKQIAEQISAPAAIIIKKETLEEYVSTGTGEIRKRDIPEIAYQTQQEKVPEILREDAIKILVDSLRGDEVVISTTGKTSRELFECRISRNEQPRDFYTVGSMGCSASIGFGAALGKLDKRIIIFDGDGAVLMQLGALATIGHYQPRHLMHIVFDNSSYDSTGGQPTVSPTVSFEKIALSCGYKSARTVLTREQIAHAYKEMTGVEGPRMLIIKVKKGARKDLGRPTTTPTENKTAFMNLLFA